MKELILNIYKFFVSQEFKYEHLGRVVKSIKHSTNDNLKLSAIYSTGLYATNMVNVSANTELEPIQNDKHIIIEPESDIVKEVLDLNDINTVEKVDQAPIKENHNIELEPNVAIPSKEVDVVEDDLVNLDAADQAVTMEGKEISSSGITTQEPTSWEEIEGPIEDLMLVDTPQGSDNEESEPTEEKKEKKTKAKKKKHKTTKQKKSKKGKRKSDVGNEEFSEFNNWLSSLESLEGANIKNNSSSKTKKKKKKKKKKSAVALSAKKSITKKEGIASETLADILIKQGHLEDGIAMFERLKRSNPDKAEYYDLKIQGIKK